MQAVVTQPPGGLENTRLIPFDEPIARDGDVLVAIHAVGLNPADRHLIDGQYPGGLKPPLIAGRDAAGVVEKADAAGCFPVGSRVVVLQSSDTDVAHGTMCERQRFPATSLAAMPDGWSFAEAAAAPLVYQTAWLALTRHGEINAGTVVAVTGAGGGVGIAAVQLALGLGATVVALSRSPEKQRRLRELGAAHVFSPDAPGLKKMVFEAIGRSGVDVVVDTVGGPLLTLAVHLLAPRGRVSVLGVLGGVEGVVPIPSLMFKQASLHGIVVTGPSPTEAATDWARIVEVLAKSHQRPVVAGCFPMTKFADAFGGLAQNPFGKVVVVMERA